MKTVPLILGAALILSCAGNVYLYSARSESHAEATRLGSELGERDRLLAAARQALPFYEQTAKDLAQQVKEFKGREDALVANTEARVRLYESQISALRAAVAANAVR